MSASVSSSALLPRRRQAAATLNPAIAGAAAFGLAALATAVYFQAGGTWRLPALVAVGAGIGAVLLRTAFGFAGAFRSLVEAGDRSGFRAHAAMLGLATLLIMPLLSLGTLFGQPLSGGSTAVGVGFAVGALLFGAGMQIGGGCASGTLFALGGGNAKLAGTLLGFVAGSALGAAHMGFWWSLPSLPAVTAQGLVGWWPGLALQLAALAGLWVWAGRRTQADAPRFRTLLLGGLALAVLNAATLVLAGKPWGETSAFALWGSKAVTALGWDAHAWAYWQRPGFAKQLDRVTSLDVTSVMDGAIVLGAVLTAAVAGLFRPRWGGTPRAWAGALLGGIAMGYGARLSNGCNIGAYFSAIAAGNLSGWAWMLLALAGSWMGIQLRPLFGLVGASRAEGPTC